MYPSRFCIFFSSLLTALVFLSCSGHEERSGAGALSGASVYQKYCTLCHGADGRLGVNDASDLRASMLSYDELVMVIANGRNTMQPFKEMLSDAEIEAVSRYVTTMRDEDL